VLPGHVTPGSESDAPLIGYDLRPTLASIARFPVPDDRPIDGEDFSPVLEGRRFVRERPRYWEFDDDNGFHFALRDRNWKLLTDKALEDVRLYDFTDNRFEVVDVAPERPEVVFRALGQAGLDSRERRARPLKTALV
jgi:arylsulfatase A-like enzyme